MQHRPINLFGSGKLKYLTCFLALALLVLAWYHTSSPTLFYVLPLSLVLSMAMSRARVAQICAAVWPLVVVAIAAGLRVSDYLGMAFVFGLILVVMGVSYLIERTKP
jgi:hypothetical protein